MQQTFFTSDHHFGHRGIIKYSERPFENADEMDEALIDNWNEVVAPRDQVYHLGDFSFRRPEDSAHIASRLNGRIHILLGNHDRLKPKFYEEHFEWVKRYYELKIDGRKIVLCHYPFDTWNRSHYGSWSLHGHCHGSLTTVRGGRLDIGVDTQSSGHSRFYPWNYDEILHLLKDISPTVVDHHAPRTRKSKPGVK